MVSICNHLKENLIYVSSNPQNIYIDIKLSSGDFVVWEEVFITYSTRAVCTSTFRW